MRNLTIMTYAVTLYPQLMLQVNRFLIRQVPSVTIVHTMDYVYRKFMCHLLSARQESEMNLTRAVSLPS